MMEPVLLTIFLCVIFTEIRPATHNVDDLQDRTAEKDTSNKFLLLLLLLDQKWKTISNGTIQNMTECIWFDLWNAVCVCAPQSGSWVLMQKHFHRMDKQQQIGLAVWLAGWQTRMDSMQAARLIICMFVRACEYRVHNVLVCLRLILDTRETSYQHCWCYFIHSSLSEAKVFFFGSVQFTYFGPFTDWHF